ncbi:MAG: hypothetical protein HRU29_09820 [Rhizobiales bacterium]|nr:hypothetical protein [Hyphomicrobiales bacterium]NRB14688.1 hypothetical protein [Hyphomicrobiales bacterium]
MKKIILAAAFAAMISGTAFADTYSITVTNNLAEELLAPIVVTSTSNDGFIFNGSYVTPAAEEQILTGDPAKVVASIGADMVAVGHGLDGPPSVLLKPGASITFEFETDATSLRILAMVAPTMFPDNYVSNVVDIHATTETIVKLHRFDIGYDEGTKTNTRVSNDAATVVIIRK